MVVSKLDVMAASSDIVTETTESHPFAAISVSIPFKLAALYIVPL